MTIAQYSGTLYPDYSFSLGVVPKKKPKADKDNYWRSVATQEGVDYGALSDWLEGSTRLLGETCSLSEAPLFINSPKSSRTKRGCYGKHGITGFGKKFIRNSALLLERRYTKERLGFVTCTMPSCPEILQRRLNGIWSEIVRRFYQKVKRQLEKLSEPFIYCGVTEIQEKRYRRTGIPVPHLHFVYLCRGVVDKRYWLYVCQLHRAWNESLSEGIRLCNYPLPDDFYYGTGSVHAKRVKKSVASYLGKYMSKGGNVLKDMQDNGWSEFPKQWWNADMSTKKLFASALIHLDTHTCDSFFNDLPHYLHEGMITDACYVSVDIGGNLITLGLVGKLSKQAYELIKSG